MTRCSSRQTSVLGSYQVTGLLATLCAIAAGGCNNVRETSLTADQINNRARPATVIVAAKFEVSIEVPEVELDAARLQSDFSSSIAGKDLTDDQQVKMFFDVFLGKPDRYLHAGTERQRLPSAELYSLGTGFIITPDGYLLTNAHVVKPNDEALGLKSLMAISQQIERKVEDLNKLIRTLLPGHEMTGKTKDAVIRTYANEYLRHGVLDPRPAEAISLTGYDERPGNTEPNFRSCRILKVGKPGSGTDVAVLKIDGEGDLPTVPLAAGTVDTLKAGSDLFVVGYPGNLAIDPAFKLSSRLDSSLSQGRVNGLKEMTDGAKVIQMDAVIHPGNSGSPVFDSVGRALGLATFVVNEDETAEGSRGLAFVVPIDAARSFLKELQITPRQSAFTAKYLEALRQYEGHNDTRALAIFRQLNDQRPDVVAIHEFMKRLSKGGESSGTGPVVRPTPAPAVITPRAKTGIPMAVIVFGAIGAAIVIVIGLVIAAANRS